MLWSFKSKARAIGSVNTPTLSPNIFAPSPLLPRRRRQSAAAAHQERIPRISKTADHRASLNPSTRENSTPTIGETSGPVDTRVLAIAAVHERLYSGKEIGVVLLDAFLTNLCSHIEDALGRAGGIQLDLASVAVPADMAVPVALVVNELLTNAIKYGRPPYRVGLTVEDERLVLMVSDGGEGPAADNPRTGLGSQIIAAGIKQLGAALETNRDAAGYQVVLTVPLQALVTHEGANSRR